MLEQALEFAGGTRAPRQERIEPPSRGSQGPSLYHETYEDLDRTVASRDEGGPCGLCATLLCRSLPSLADGIGPDNRRLAPLCKTCTKPLNPSALTSPKSEIYAGILAPEAGKKREKQWGPWVRSQFAILHKLIDLLPYSGRKRPEFLNNEPKLLTHRFNERYPRNPREFRQHFQPQFLADFRLKTAKNVFFGAWSRSPRDGTNYRCRTA